MVSKSDAEATQASAGAAGGTVSDTVTGQDVHTDERYEVGGADHAEANFRNEKRTYDLHQTLDADALLDKRKHQAKLDSMEIAEREQRLQHQAKVNSIEIHEREQSRRHYEDMHSLRFFASFGFAADTVQEAFADMVATRVCERLEMMKGAK